MSGAHSGKILALTKKKHVEVKYATCNKIVPTIFHVADLGRPAEIAEYNRLLSLKSPK